jgi:hypothetical protein
MASIARGHKFNTSSKDASMPVQQRTLNITELLDHQSNVGAYQSRSQEPNDRDTA